MVDMVLLSATLNLKEVVMQIQKRHLNSSNSGTPKRKINDPVPVSYDDIDFTSATIVPPGNVRKQDSPVLDALLISSIFRTKKMQRQNSTEYNTDIHVPLIYSTDSFFRTIRVAEDEYIHTIVNMATLTPLNQGDLKMFFLLMNIFQARKTNKTELAMGEIMDYLGHKKESRNSHMKKRIKNQILSLGNIIMETKQKTTSGELTESQIKNETDFDYQTSYWHPVFVEYDNGIFYVALSTLLYDVYEFTTWNAVDFEEFKRLTLESAKTLYRYITYRDIGGSGRLVVDLDKLLSKTALDDFPEKEAKRKLKQGLAQLHSEGVIRDYEIDTAKNVRITIIPKRLRHSGFLANTDDSDGHATNDKKTNDRPEGLKNHSDSPQARRRSAIMKRMNDALDSL